MARMLAEAWKNPAMDRKADALEARILAFVRDPERGDFDELALALFARQFAKLPDYRARCESLGASPETVGRWTEIPAVGAASGQATSPDPSERAAESAGARASDLASAAIRRSAPELIDPGRLRLVVGAPAGASPEPCTDSVVELLGALGRDAPDGSFVAPERLDAKKLRSWLGARQRDREPVAVIGAPSGLARVADVLERRAVKFRLPPGSEAFCVSSFAGAAADPEGSWREPLLELLGLAEDACRRVLAGPRGSTPLLEPPPLALAGTTRPRTAPHWVRVTRAREGLLAVLDLASLDTAARRLEPAAGARFLEAP